MEHFAPAERRRRGGEGGVRGPIKAPVQDSTSHKPLLSPTARGESGLVCFGGVEALRGVFQENKLVFLAVRLDMGMQTEHGQEAFIC